MSESRGVLGQKLHLAGCTIIVGAGRGWRNGCTAVPTRYRYQVPGTYYVL